MNSLYRKYNKKYYNYHNFYMHFFVLKIKHIYTIDIKTVP